MLNAALSKIAILALLATVRATPLGLAPREDCKPCNPEGASGTNPPTVGSDLKDLYVDLLSSVKDIHFQKRREDLLETRNDGFCCRESLDCVNVQNLNIPMCYDKFTTNYAFADGSFGSLTSGDYTASDGSNANLIDGQYTKKGGETGDIYSSDPSAKPNTATLSVPPQFTGTGVGSAIPASEIGSVVVISTTIGGTTVTGPTTLPASTALGTTISSQTISGTTTIPPKTAVMTTTVAAHSSAAPSSSSKGAAAHVQSDSTGSLGMSLFMALVCALYAL